MSFSGFSHETFDFYRNLTADNSKEFWKRNREIYDRAVRTPMEELAGELSGEFGEVQVLRPQRDSRFSNDKSPYKTYQGAYLDIEPCLGYWVQIDASGLYASGRFYPYDPAEVVRYREAVDAEGSGTELAELVTRLREEGFEVGESGSRRVPGVCRRTIPGSICSGTGSWTSA
ncbi:DUF2461 family protein [Streptosporangium lutulentum]